MTRKGICQAVISETLFFAGIQLGGFAGEAGPSEAVEFVGKCRFDGLAAIAESLLGDEFVDLLEQFCV